MNQHKPSLTPLAHITLNLLNATQFRPGYRFRGQGMKHVCATMLTTVHLHHTGLPIDTGIGGLQPVYSQHNVMVQLRQNLAIDSAMQRLTVPRAYNLGMIRILHRVPTRPITVGTVGEFSHPHKPLP